MLDYRNYLFQSLPISLSQKMGMLRGHAIERNKTTLYFLLIFIYLTLSILN